VTRPTRTSSRTIPRLKTGGLGYNPGDTTEDPEPPVDRAEEGGQAFVPFLPPPDTAPAIVNESEDTVTGFVASWSFTPTAGNVLLLFVWRRGGSASLDPATPSGWTLLESNRNPTSSHDSVLCYGKESDGTETSVTFGAEIGRPHIVEISGVTFDDMETATDTAASATTTVTTGTVTPTASRQAIIFGSDALANDTFTTRTHTPDMGWTELQDSYSGQTAAPFPGLYYQIVESTTGSYTPGATASAVGGAFPPYWRGITIALLTPSGDSVLVWAPAPLTIDGDDATFEDALSDSVDASPDLAFWRATLADSYLIASFTAEIGFETAGSVMVTLQGANEADYSDAVTVTSDTITATGSYTADTVSGSWTPTAVYRYWQLLIDAADAVRVYEVSLFDPATFTGAHGDLTGRDAAEQHPADAVTYDNGTSGLIATDVQAAIDEVVASGSADVPEELRWYNVEDYGAVHDGVTDDTAAIQAAIDDCFANGGGVIFFPKDDDKTQAIYLIAGALQDTSTYNSQLEIPYNASGLVTLWFYTYGATLRSNWNGTISGEPSIISAGEYDPAALNGVFVVFDNLRVEYKADPKLTAIDMRAAATFRWTRLSMAPYESYTSAVPTHSNAVGLDLPFGLNDQNSGGDAFWCDGMYTALRPSEQMIADAVYASYNRIGVEMRGSEGSPDYLQHAAIIQRLNIWFTLYGIKHTGDPRTLIVSLMDVEHNDPSPWATVYDVDDSSNYGRGMITLHTLDYVTGVPINDALINGGTGYSFHIPYEKRWTLSSVVTIPTGTNPSTNPSTGRRLYADSADGHLSARDSSGNVIDYETDISGVTVSGTPSSGQVLTATSSSAANWQDPATSSGTGETDHFHIVDEQFSGDGATTVFYLANEAVADTVMAYVSGTRTPVTLGGSLNDEITFGSAPASASLNISVDYAAVSN
jgi:hypothetical protein